MCSMMISCTSHCERIPPLTELIITSITSYIYLYIKKVYIRYYWRRKWQTTPVFLPGESQGWGSLVGCCLWGRTELDTTDATQQHVRYYIYIPHIFLVRTLEFYTQQISIIEHSVINYSHCVTYHILRPYSGLCPSTNLSLFLLPHKPWQPVFTLYVYTPCLLTLF